MTRYPPMRALLAFEAAARLSSFTLAAAELSVTPGAISQQVKKLEEWLGAELFVRETRQLTITDVGEHYYQQILLPLNQIAQASENVVNRQKRSVCISMPPSVAAKWFSPRMPLFMREFPLIELRLNATTALVDVDHGNVDVGICYYDGQSPLLENTFLAPDECRVYCHPGYQQTHNLLQPEALSRATLLHTSLHPHWADWLALNTALSKSQIKAILAISFDQSLLAIEAAKRQQGVVLTSRLLVEEELQQGTLIELFDLPYSTGQAFYLVNSCRKTLSADVIAVREWLLSQHQ
ncbi:LysR substrate-binding domain-containing protein [Edaphovirga cremea]|uniref:LysR substrate-binding domain-containing protein n=1 Tax=Edaphovirga cremea TaxID=2267246 RepID=UPI000DEF034F|nr:LysR substrate-binding domain-containing protein [Edaphovirga cremea]